MKRLYAPGDVAALKRACAPEGRKREFPAGTLVRVLEEVEPESSSRRQVLRCAVGVKSIVGYVVVPRTWLVFKGDIEAFIDAIEQIERRPS